MSRDRCQDLFNRPAARELSTLVLDRWKDATMRGIMASVWLGSVEPADAGANMLSGRPAQARALAKQERITG
jgi:hypothetical protein